MPSWIAARVTQARSVSAKFSQSLASRRLRPNHEKARSTTQRRGNTTKPDMSSVRFTISMRKVGMAVAAPFTWWALLPPSAQTSSSHRKIVTHRPAPP